MIRHAALSYVGDDHRRHFSAYDANFCLDNRPLFDVDLRRGTFCETERGCREHTNPSEADHVLDSVS